MFGFFCGPLKVVLPARLQRLVGELNFPEFLQGNIAENLAGILRDLFGPTK